MADINKIAEELGTLTILEAADLVKLLEEKWGVSAAAPVAAAGAAAAPAEAEEEKTEFWWTPRNWLKALPPSSWKQSPRTKLTPPRPSWKKLAPR